MRYKYWAVTALVTIITIFGSIAAFASPIAPDSPDLTVDNISISPLSPSLGDTVTFSVIIKNIGNERAGMSKTDYYVDDTLIFSDVAGSLESGSSLIMTASWKAQAGDHIIKAVSNADGRIIESNQVNNDLTMAFSVLAPDLVISDISWSPGSSSVQEFVSFSVTVKNQGNGSSPGSALDFLIDGASRGFQDVQRLDAGASALSTFKWIALPGSHEIKAVADALGQVNESDETNNTKTMTYTTLVPDLVVQSITWSTTNISEGHYMAITSTVKNRGAGASYASWVAYYIDGLPLTSVFVPPLSSNASFPNTVLWKAEYGSHNVTATADSLAAILESDKTNNSKTVSLPEIFPDLAVRSITWSPSDPTVGQRVTFAVTVQNQGYADVSGVTLLQFNVDSLSYYTYLGPMDIGETISATFNLWVAEPGRHYVRAIADADNTTAEISKLNNVMITTISASYPVLPDLLVQKIVWSPKNPVMGQTADFTVTVKNQGAGIASPSSIAFYMDGSYLTSSSVDTLKAGAAATIDIPWQASGGSHSLEAIVDPGQILTEPNKTNNVFTVGITVLTPDLYIKDVSWTPPHPSQGDAVTFTVTVSNRGNDSAGPSSLDYFVDNSPRGSHYLEELAAGASVTKTFTCVAPAENFVFKVVADAENKILESDKTNNETLVSFPVPDKPEEVITGNESTTKTPVDPSDNVTIAPVLSGAKVTATELVQSGNISSGNNSAPVKIGDVHSTKPASPFKPGKKVAFNWWLMGGTGFGTVITGAVVLLAVRLRKTGHPPLVTSVGER